MYLNTPIVRANKSFPDWWKELPTFIPKFGSNETHDHTVINYATVKDCYAFSELYKKGIIIENWCDISIKSNPTNFLYYYSGNDAPDVHSKGQLGRGFNNYHHIKLTSPWHFNEKTGVKFLWMGAEWSLDNLNIKVLPGIVSYDIMSLTNVNIMFPCIDNEFIIPVGNPLVHLIPITEKKLVINNIVVSKEELEKRKLNAANASFFGWRKVLHLRERNRKRGTCPFSSGE